MVIGIAFVQWSLAGGGGEGFKEAKVGGAEKQVSHSVIKM